jgi:anti-sigma regulatory factor (Ser/Thr protein kinase)
MAELSVRPKPVPIKETSMISAEQVEPARRSGPPVGCSSATAPWDLSPAGRRREWRLRTVESSVTALRRSLTAFLDTIGLSDDEFYDVILAASEAASNAVEHAQHPAEPFFDVSAEVDDGQVTIVVQDYGRWLPPRSSLYRGRGLAMMRVLADTTVEAGTHGTTVTIRNRSVSPAVLSENEGRAS